MPFVHGRRCEVIAQEYDLTEFFRSSSLSADVDTAETSTFRKDWKTFVPGMAGGTISLDGLYDTDRTDELHGYLAQLLPLVATVGPGGLKTGDLARMIRAHSTSLSNSAAVGDVVAISWALQSTEEIYFGHALNDVETAITGDGAGPSIDTGAAISDAAWCLHWHLTDLDGTGLTLAVEDSPDGSTDWQPISGVTTGAQAAVGAGRVTGIGDVRRHIRVAHDITGTSANFAAAFARRS